MTDEHELTNEQQRNALTDDVVRAYANGEIAWSQIRAKHGVTSFSLLLCRLGESGLRLPRADPNRPTQARTWLREALAKTLAQVAAE